MQQEHERFGQRAAENVLIVILALTPVLVAVRYRWAQLVFPFAAAAILFLLVRAPDSRTRIFETLRSWISGPMALVGMVALLWIVLTVIVATDRLTAAIIVVKALGFVGAALAACAILTTVSRRRVFPLLVWTYLAAVLGAGFTAVTEGAAHRIFDCCRGGMQADVTGSAIMTALLVWPVAGWLFASGRRLGALLVVVLACAVVSVSRSGASGIALAAGLLTIGIGAWRPRAAVAVPLAITIAGFASALFLGDLKALPEPFNFLDSLSAFHAVGRVEIWSYYTDLFWQRPWTGFGPGSERLLGDSAFSSSFTNTIPPDNSRLHPHNTPVQILIEFGIVGMVLALIAAITTAIQVIKTDPPRSPFAIAPAAGFATASLVNFGLWEWWWLSLVFIALIFASQLPRWGEAVDAARPVPASAANNLLPNAESAG